jgi:Putative beta-barrel porin-2, OmpL-like. bbp2
MRVGTRRFIPSLNKSSLCKAWPGTRGMVFALACVLAAPVTSRAQQSPAASLPSPASPTLSDPMHALQAKVEQLEARDARLEAELEELREEMHAKRSEGSGGPHVDMDGSLAATASSRPVTEATPVAQNVAATSTAGRTLSEADREILDFLKGTTTNVSLDGYYAYNFNHPIGRVNLLRSYDVLSNAFSLNQASVMFEHAPEGAAGKRFGLRLDLQFGQATATLQGNPANEPRPDIYRNIFQAYGTYVVPLGHGLTVDFGKWGSSLGMEGNYSKDQINYSRAYWFDFLPFYHMGIRASYPVNDKLTLNYWIVNGTQQTEPTNAYKDQLFGFTATPRKTITWNVNYYRGQEHPDALQIPNSGPIPIQPGLNFVAIRPAPDGRLHIFDSYVGWQVTPKLALHGEADYVIERLWRNASVGHSSAPTEVAGGAAYARYEISPRIAFGARAEYLSDRQGMFSGVSQALKETTATFDYKLADGFLMRYEWRRDFSNQAYFLTDVQGGRSTQQNTATVGLIWWVGRKQGAW